MTPTSLTPTVSDRCDAIIARYRLLDHPFYRAWADGTLPVAALADYAREYGAFVETIARGWEAAGDPAIARIEEGHARIWWRSFAAGLETDMADPVIPEVGAALAAAHDVFGARSTALGGLYAFEAQQPLTARSKLAGLREHYTQLPEACGEYFRLHQDDYDEPARLAAAMSGLDASDQARALAACEQMSQALYAALSGIYAPYADMDCEPI